MKIVKMAVLAASMLSVTPLAAQTVTIMGDTTGGPTWNRPVAAGPSLSFVCTACAYQAIGVTITDPASFRAEIVAAPFDTYLHVYRGSFDPNNQFVNLVAGDDDGGVVLLSEVSVVEGDGPFVAGAHVVVVSAFADGSFGPFTLELAGATLLLPVADAPIHFTEIVLETTRDRHGAVPRALAGSMNARTESAMWKNANAPTAHITNNGTVSGRMHLWADLGGGGSDSGTSGLSVRVANTQVGLDYTLSDNFAAGLAIGAGVSSSKAGASKIEGYSYWVQPYVGTRFGKASATASVAIARDEYDDINLSGVIGSGSGFTFSGNVNLRWDEPLVDGWFLTPYASGTIGRVRLSDTNVAGLATGSLDFFDVAAGIEFRNEFDWGFGASQFWLRGEGRKTYAEAPSSGFAITGHDSTRFGFGFATGASIMVDDHVSVGGEAGVDGLGSDVVSFGGRLNATIGF